jgi:EAL domain-containing protein (putative c-di-GMP-specific phosphodiesterase class I)
VLVFLANLLRACKRPEDLAARVGGDEFVMVIPPIEGQDHQQLVQAFIDRLRTELTQPLLYDGRACRFGVSIGVAHSDLIDDNPSRLLTYADVALYETKSGGRGGVTVYTPRLHWQTVKEREAADEVVGALEDDQIVPYFQVQTCARSGAVKGFEVLARWRHPEKGILPPAAFLETAARLKKTHLVDRMVFSKSVEVFRRCTAMGLRIPKLSFNVSTPRLYDRDFVEGLIAAHDEGLQIAVELLESILLEEVDSHILHNLDILRDHGIQIEVDDFGSGRASIVGVMRVNPDRIKLDQQLVFPLPDSVTMRSLVRHIIGMAEGLGVRVTAEGVESAEHAGILRDLGAETLQGHHFGMPCDERAMVSFLRDGRGPAQVAG